MFNLLSLWYGIVRYDPLIDTTIFKIYKYWEINNILEGNGTIIFIYLFHFDVC